MITAAKVANATQGQLLQMTYELLLHSMDHIKKYGLAKDHQELIAEVQHARRILQELIDTLNFEQDLSKDLLRIYVYINGILIKNLISYDGALIEEAKGLINKLLEGWSEVVASNEGSIKVMNNAQQVYAGLTYGKSDLNESVLDDTNRGFKA